MSGPFPSLPKKSLKCFTIWSSLTGNTTNQRQFLNLRKRKNSLKSSSGIRKKLQLKTSISSVWEEGHWTKTWFMSKAPDNSQRKNTKRTSTRRKKSIPEMKNIPTANIETPCTDHSGYMYPIHLFYQ